jgi:hypothetical protein
MPAHDKGRQIPVNERLDSRAAGASRGFGARRNCRLSLTPRVSGVQSGPRVPEPFQRFLGQVKPLKQLKLPLGQRAPAEVGC